MSTDPHKEEALRAILGTSSQLPSRRERRATAPPTRQPSTREKKGPTTGKSVPSSREKKKPQQSNRERKTPAPPPQPSNRERKQAQKRTSDRPVKQTPQASGRERRHKNGSMKEMHKPTAMPTPASPMPIPVYDGPLDHTTEFCSMEQAVMVFCDVLGKKGYDGIMAEYCTIKAWKPSPCLTTAFDQNMDKNRYKDVPCIDWSRVPLRPMVAPTVPSPTDPNDPDGIINVDADAAFTMIAGQSMANDRMTGGDDYGDDMPPFSLGTAASPSCHPDEYIHANYVEDYFRGVSESSTRFICTQGPFTHTIWDFWRMVFQQDVRCIVMLCKCIELTKDKCAEYYPTELNATKDNGVLRVTCMEGHKLASDGMYSLRLKVEEIGTGKCVNVGHYQWVDWPDKSVPLSTVACIILGKHLNKQTFRRSIIHCSAGIGRTGTLVALSLCIQRVQNKRYVDMPWLIKMIRQQRVHSVQTQQQYAFVYRAFIDFLAKDERTKNLIKSHRGVLKFNRDYDQALNAPPMDPAQLQMMQMLQMQQAQQMMAQQQTQQQTQQQQPPRQAQPSQKPPPSMVPSNQPIQHRVPLPLPVQPSQKPTLKPQQSMKPPQLQVQGGQQQARKPTGDEA